MPSVVTVTVGALGPTARERLPGTSAVLGVQALKDSREWTMEVIGKALSGRR